MCISIVDVGIVGGKLRSKMTLPLIKSVNTADILRDACFNVSKGDGDRSVIIYSLEYQNQNSKITKYAIDFKNIGDIIQEKGEYGQRLIK